MLSRKIKNNFKRLAGIITESKIVKEITPDEVEINQKLLQDTLNPALWTPEGELHSDVREKLLEIAHKYYEFLEVKGELKGIQLLGSNTNYNWTSLSDIDVHIVVDFKEIGEDPILVKEYLDAKKELWKEKHHIVVKGYDVECYAQDIEEKPDSAGVFNLVKNKWEQKPEKENFQIDKKALKSKIAALINSIDELISNKKKTSEELYKTADILKEKIKSMRKAGLAQGGEFSIENLAFKYLRNNGYLEKLFGFSTHEFDKSLSLKESIKRKSVLKESVIKPRHKLVIKQSVDNLDSKKIELIKKFIIFCCEELGIDQPCKVYLTNKRGGPIITTASYHPDTDDIWIYCKGRGLLADILRSTAHEIRHFKQKLDGVLREDSGKDGSEHENEANSFSGSCIRKFGRENREIFD